MRSLGLEYKFSVAKLTVFLWLSFASKSCTSPVQLEPNKGAKIEIQGHRGCRGLMPENSIPAFRKAIELGVKTFELDVVVSKDYKVVVSHEPWLSPEICTDSEGRLIGAASEKKWNIYGMTYDSLRRFDCGLKVHPRFPNQQKTPCYKPLLSELIDSIRQLIPAEDQQLLWYNIEIKRQATYDSVYCPPVDTFVDLVLALIKEKGIEKNCNIQSFDLQTLQICKQKAPLLPLSLLVQNNRSPQENVKALGFKPDIYSCHFKLVNQALIDWKNLEHILLIPWTVNTKEDAAFLLQWPIDGIITDYPNKITRRWCRNFLTQ